MRIDRYRSQLQKAVEKRATIGERIFGALFPSRGIGWPGGWTQNRLEEVMHCKNWTYVATHTISCLVAQHSPNFAYKRRHAIPGRTTKGGLPEQLKQVTYAGRNFLAGYHSKSLGHVIKPHDELEPLPDDHPLIELFDNPNPMDTTFDLLYETQLFLALTGIAYWWMIPNRFGRPAEIWVMPSNWVWPRTGASRYVSPERPNADKLIQYYEIRPWGGLGAAGSVKIPPSEILSFNWKSPLNKIDGYSKLSAVAQWIDTEESIGKSRWAQMMNQARSEMWIELGEGYEDPDDNTIARIEAKIMAKYQGEFNYGKPIITPPGAKVQALSFNPTEMAYFQSEEQIRDMILSAFQVPKAAVGISNEMTYGSILATLMQLCQFGINPILAMMGQRATKMLTPLFQDEGGEKILMWWDDCSPPDPSQVNADIQADVAAKAITPNEIRALRGRKPYKHGGDDPMGTMGDTPIPMNTGDDFSELAQLMAGGGQQPGAEGQPGEEQPGAGFGVQEPNGEPQKSLPRPGKIVQENGRWKMVQLEAPAGYVWSDSWSALKLKQLHQFATAQINLPDSLASQIKAFAAAIPDADLAADGRQQDIHLTLRYGLHTQNPHEVGAILSQFPPAQLTLAATNVFAGVEHDVLWVSLEHTENLHAMNEALSHLDHTDTQLQYIPHITIAYLKAGLGRKYAGNSFMHGKAFVATEAVYCSPDASCVTLPFRSMTVKSNGYHHRMKGESYFATCERDPKTGYCLPSGQAGSNGNGNGKHPQYNKPEQHPAHQLRALFDKVKAGGFTYNLLSHNYPTKGFVLSVYPEHSWADKKAEDLTLHDLASYALKNRKLLGQSDHFMGGWLNKDDGKVYLDVTIIKDNQEEALKLCKEKDQLAMFNLETFTEIPCDPNATSGGAKSHGRRNKQAGTDAAEGRLNSGRTGGVLQAANGEGPNRGRDRGSAKTVGSGGNRVRGIVNKLYCKPGQNPERDKCTINPDAGKKPTGGQQQAPANKPATSQPQAKPQGKPQASKPSNKLPTTHPVDRGSSKEEYASPTVPEGHAPPPKGQKITPVPCCLLRNDPHSDANGDGVADAAMIGVPAMEIPKQIPRLPNLTEEERKVEGDFARMYEKHADTLCHEYLRRKNVVVGKDKEGNNLYEIGDAPNSFSTDDAKLLNADYNNCHGQKKPLPDDCLAAKSRYNICVHQTANAIAKKAFLKYLDDVVSKLPDDKKQVLITSGGCGAGKTYSLQSTGLFSTVGAVWDAAGEQNATENPWVLAECRKRGLKTIFAYTYNDPIKTWADPKMGVVQRAIGKGRMISADVYASSVVDGAKAMAAFHEEHKDDADVSFIMRDNTAVGQPPKPINEVPETVRKLDTSKLYADCYKILNERKDLPEWLKDGGNIGARIFGLPPGETTHGT